jgi:nicotinamidase/pyrazinamidase
MIDMGIHDRFSEPTEMIRCPVNVKSWAKDLLRAVDRNPHLLLEHDKLLRKSMKLQAHMLLIDPQNDFCDISNAPLPVPGGNVAMDNVANLLKEKGNKLRQIHVTMDSHRQKDIAHPYWWVNQNGDFPSPHTVILASDIESGIWRTRDPRAAKRSLAYVKELERQGLDKLYIWPPHCIIGEPGWCVQNNVNKELQKWSIEKFDVVNYVTKGSNMWTEHYGALQAEVPDPEDPSTSLNVGILKVLSQADIILVAGLAESHCVLRTIQQIAKNIGDEHLSKFHILSDCTACIPAVPNGPDFPAITKKSFAELEKKGMVLTNSQNVLA